MTPPSALPTIAEACRPGEGVAVWHSRGRHQLPAAYCCCTAALTGRPRPPPRWGDASTLHGEQPVYRGGRPTALVVVARPRRCLADVGGSSRW